MTDLRNLYQNAPLPTAAGDTSAGDKPKKEWTFMGVQGHKFRDGNQTIRILPPHPARVQTDPRVLPYAEVVRYGFEMRLPDGPGYATVLSYKSVFGEGFKDPLELDRCRVMFDHAARYPKEQSKQLNREWIKENDQYEDQTDRWAFVMLGREEEENGEHFLLAYEEGDLRAVRIPNPVRDVIPAAATHRDQQRRCNLVSPFMGNDIYVSRTQQGQEKLNKRYAADWGSSPGPLFYHADGREDYPRIEAFLNSLPDVHVFATERHQFGSEHSQTDCALFSPEQIYDLMSFRRTREECVAENIWKYKQGQKLLSEREWAWLREYGQRVFRKKDYSEYPLEWFGRTSASVPPSYPSPGERVAAADEVAAQESARHPSRRAAQERAYKREQQQEQQSSEYVPPAADNGGHAGYRPQGAPRRQRQTPPSQPRPSTPPDGDRGANGYTPDGRWAPGEEGGRPSDYSYRPGDEGNF